MLSGAAEYTAVDREAGIAAVMATVLTGTVAASAGTGAVAEDIAVGDKAVVEIETTEPIGPCRVLP